jgi:hypothetical protein
MRTAGAMSGITTVYLSLVDENVNVRRPVQAQHIEGNIYQIANQPYDRDIERWEFEPGDRVVCEPLETTEGCVLAPIGWLTAISDAPRIIH